MNSSFVRFLDRFAQIVAIFLHFRYTLDIILKKYYFLQILHA